MIYLFVQHVGYIYLCSMWVNGLVHPVWTSLVKHGQQPHLNSKMLHRCVAFI